jgi:hypothetical protein
MTAETCSGLSIGTSGERNLPLFWGTSNQGGSALAGALDPMVTIDDERDLAAALPPDQRQFVEFENAGHTLAREHPETVIALIRDFIQPVS